MRALPLGLTGEARMIKDVSEDTILTYADVQIDEKLLLLSYEKNVKQ